MVGKWDRWHTTRDEPNQFGMKVTYEKAVEWLDLPGAQLEDWGGGTGFASKFVRQAQYSLVDGSQSKFVDKIVDLTTYRTSVECILMRHVLEHNHEWRAILDNMLASWTMRGAIVFFEPFVEETVLVRKQFPSYAFSREDVAMPIIAAGVTTREEQFGSETIWFLSRA